MAKKVLTPEEYKAKADKKVDKRKRFFKAFLTTLAYALACVVVYSAVAIAYTPNVSVTVPTGSVNAASPNAADPSDNPADVPGGDDSNKADDPAAPADDGNKGDKPADADKSDETQKAIDLYKTAVTKAKSSSKTVTHTKTGATNYKNIVEAGKLSSAASTLMGAFMKESEPNKVVDKAELPPEGGAGKLTKATVKSATVKEEGNYQVVTINFKDAVNPVRGADGIGAAVNVIEESQITDAIKMVPGLNLDNIKVAYENVYVTCKIEKATGNMVYLFVDAPCVLSLNAKLGFLSVDNAKVGIECKDEYTIAW